MNNSNGSNSINNMNPINSNINWIEIQSRIILPFMDYTGPQYQLTILM